MKALLPLLLALIIYVVSMKFQSSISTEILHIFLYPAIFLLVNYAGFKMILWYIKYYNDLLIIYDGQLIVVRSSLLFKDYLEFIDINKITKLDMYCKWFWPNVLGFWTIVAEQQRDQVREFYFVPKPFKAIHILNEEKQRTIEERKNTYVHNIEEKVNK